MELTVATIISILSITFAIITFALNRKDKAVKDGQDSSSSLKLLEYRLNEVDRKLNELLSKLDRYDDEIDKRVEKAIFVHIKEYHKDEKEK